MGLKRGSCGFSKIVGNEFLGRFTANKRCGDVCVLLEGNHVYGVGLGNNSGCETEVAESSVTVDKGVEAFTAGR